MHKSDIKTLTECIYCAITFEQEKQLKHIFGTVLESTTLVSATCKTILKILLPDKDSTEKIKQMGICSDTVRGCVKVTGKPNKRKPNKRV